MTPEGMMVLLTDFEAQVRRAEAAEARVKELEAQRDSFQRVGIRVQEENEQLRAALQRADVLLDALTPGRERSDLRLVIRAPLAQPKAACSRCGGAGEAGRVDQAMTPDRLEEMAREFLLTQGLVVREGPGHELQVRTLTYRGPEVAGEYAAHLKLVVDALAQARREGAEAERVNSEALDTLNRIAEVLTGECKHGTAVGVPAHQWPTLIPCMIEHAREQGAKAERARAKRIVQELGGEPGTFVTLDDVLRDMILRRLEEKRP